MYLYISFSVSFGVLTHCMARSAPLSPNNIRTNLSPGYEKPDFCRDLECPKYTPISTKKDEYELRKYESARWVSTNISGIDMKDAGNKAFYRLFDYISGNNTEGVKIDMTAPVINHVIPGSGPLCENNFTYSFFVPFRYQESGPPEPTNKDVYLSTIKEHQAYVRQFPGFAITAEDWVSQADILTANLSTDGLIDQVDQSFFYTAGYDSPFQLFNRHNEIWLFVKSGGGGGGGGNKNQNIFSDNKLRWIH